MTNIKTTSYNIVDTLFDLDSQTMGVVMFKCKHMQFDSFQEFDDYVFITKHNSEEHLIFEERWNNLNSITKNLMFDSVQWCIKNNYRI